MEQTQRNIEALLFASEQSISINDLQTILSAFQEETLTEEIIQSNLETIKEKYLSEEFVFELIEMSNGYQFLSKKTHYDLLNMLIIHKEKKKLSTSAMETLAIIAYKQPITKTEVELIRGVNCDYSVQKLLEKDLISIQGRSSGPGKPILYETSESFMDHFGLKTVRDLPQLKDLHSLENSISPEDYSMNQTETISTEEAAYIDSEGVEEAPKVSDSENDSNDGNENSSIL